jgi:type VI secretion system protein ImpL
VAGGKRTVLIYGGSLASEPEQNTALRKLRRGRPRTIIARVLPQSLNLTPNQRQRFTRLEKISELLRYSAPVWLWQLCDAKWSQAKRLEQPVEANFPLGAKADDISRQQADAAACGRRA